MIASIGGCAAPKTIEFFRVVKPYPKRQLSVAARAAQHRDGSPLDLKRDSAAGRRGWRAREAVHAYGF
jgi:hypothetical protein